MLTIRELLESKEPNLLAVTEETAVREAARRMVEHKVGSALVRDDEGRLIGILTERDVLRIIAGNDVKVLGNPVSEFMTRELYFAKPDEDLDYAANVMTKMRFRHLPVVDGKELLGILSIGDVVRGLKSHAEYENHLLRDYISGKYW